MPNPLSLIAELTYSCPLKCPYCSNPLDYGSDRYRQELTTEEWVRTIEQAAKLGVVQIGFTGGEPLLRKDLTVLVNTSATAGIYSTLVTAGTLLTLDLATQLQDAGLDHVQISIQDSHASASDWIAGTRSHDRKLAAAKLVKSLGFPLTINVVLHRHNLDRIAEILDLCEELEADRVELANTQYYGWALQNQASLLPTREQLQQAEQIVATRRNGRMKILYVLSDYYQDYPKPCMGGWGKRALVVAPNGSVLPCQVASSIPNLTFTNVRDRSLDWIWFEDPAFNRFRGTDWMSEPCRNCDRREIDFGGCRCQAYLLTGDATATDPVCHLSPHHHLISNARVETTQKPAFIYRRDF
jgi:pyrroloquinoline quinone biosynthesis protein E